MQAISSLLNNALAPQHEPSRDSLLAPSGQADGLQTSRPVQQTAELPAELSSGLSPRGRLLSESYHYASQFEQKNAGSIEVMTRDGDRVEISFSSQLESSIQKTFQQDTSGQSSSYLNRQSTSMSFQLSVQGELDEGEREALQELMKDLGKLASRFYEGDIDSAIRAAMKLELDASELKSLHVDLTQSTRLEVAQQYQRTQLIDADAEPAADSQRSGPGALAELFADLQQWLEQLNEAANLQNPNDASQRLLNQMLSALDEHQADELTAYLDQLLEQFYSEQES